jgi:hypothetical protein
MEDALEARVAHGPSTAGRIADSMPYALLLHLESYLRSSSFQSIPYVDSETLVHSMLLLSRSKPKL